MPYFIQEMIETSEKHAGKELQLYSTLDTPNKMTKRHEDEPELDDAMYYMNVEKIVYFITRITVEDCDASEEMARFLS